MSSAPMDVVVAMVEKYLGRLVTRVTKNEMPKTWMKIGPQIDVRFTGNTLDVEPPTGLTWPDGGNDKRAMPLTDMAMLAITDGRCSGGGIVTDVIDIVDPGFLAWTVFARFGSGSVFKVVDLMVFPSVRPLEVGGFIHYLSGGPGLRPLEAWMGVQFAPGTVHVVPTESIEDLILNVKRR